MRPDRNENLHPSNFRPAQPATPRSLLRQLLLAPWRVRNMNDAGFTPQQYGHIRFGPPSRQPLQPLQPLAQPGPLPFTARPRHDSNYDNTRFDLPSPQPPLFDATNSARRQTTREPNPASATLERAPSTALSEDRHTVFSGASTLHLSESLYSQASPAPSLHTSIQTTVDWLAKQTIYATGLDEIKRTFPHEGQQLEQALQIAHRTLLSALARAEQEAAAPSQTLAESGRWIRKLLGQTTDAGIAGARRAMPYVFRMLHNEIIHLKQNPRRVIFADERNTPHISYAEMSPRDAIQRILFRSHFFQLGSVAQAQTVLHEAWHLACGAADTAYCSDIGIGDETPARLERSLERQINDLSVDNDKRIERFFNAHRPEFDEERSGTFRRLLRTAGMCGEMSLSSDQSLAALYRQHEPLRFLVHMDNPDTVALLASLYGVDQLGASDWAMEDEDIAAYQPAVIRGVRYWQTHPQEVLTQLFAYYQGNPSARGFTPDQARELASTGSLGTYDDVDAASFGIDDLDVLTPSAREETGMRSDFIDDNLLDPNFPHFYHPVSDEDSVSDGEVSSLWHSASASPELGMEGAASRLSAAPMPRWPVRVRAIQVDGQIFHIPWKYKTVHRYPLHEVDPENPVRGVPTPAYIDWIDNRWVRYSAPTGAEDPSQAGLPPAMAPALERTWPVRVRAIQVDGQVLHISSKYKTVHRYQLHEVDPGNPTHGFPTPAHIEKIDGQWCVPR